jgi:hypothetical protein
MTRAGEVTLLLVFLLLVTPSMSMAAESIPESPRRHVRTTDRRLRALLEEGLRLSPTLRALVARLQSSDVVVYLRCDGSMDRTDGRLTFVSAAGGYRYVVVRMSHLARDRQIAIMAHELQHAIEIAGEPAIVDGPSLAREYQRIGFVNAWAPLPGIAFDTHAAVQIGRQVMKELSQDDD